MPIKGNHTAAMREAWNLDGLEYDLMDLDIPRKIPCWINQDTGEIVNEKPLQAGGHWYEKEIINKDWKAKSRIDHRHHAIDAITVACINRSLMQQMSFDDNHGFGRRKDYPLPLSTLDSTNPKQALEIFRCNVLDTLKQTRISHKHNHSKAGQLHEATGIYVLGEIPNNKNFVLTRRSRPVVSIFKTKADLNKLLVPSNIKDEWHKDIKQDRETQLKLKTAIESFYNQAEQELKARNQALELESKKSTTITEKSILYKAFSIAQETDKSIRNKFVHYENKSSLIKIDKHKIAYNSGNNHCVDFYEYKGKVGWECINRFNANQPHFAPDWKQLKDAKHIWTVQQGDILEMDTPEEWQKSVPEKRCLVEIKKFRDAYIGITLCFDARRDAPPKEWADYLKRDLKEKGLSYYTQRTARKVELTPFGRIKRKHKALWNDKKNVMSNRHGGH